MSAPDPRSAHAELDSQIESRLEEVVRIGRDVLGDALRSVVLGGSLARGEGFGVREDGRLRLLSDLDLYFIADGEIQSTQLRQRLADWVDADPFFVSPADVAVIGPGFFSEAPAAMPTHQLASAHRVLWGEAPIISAAADREGNARVDAQDAAQLLFNRFVESMDPSLSADGALRERVHQTKRIMDAPMAWLGAKGQYSPDRREQLAWIGRRTDDWTGNARTRMDAALDLWSACLDARDRGVVERDELDRIAADPALTRDWLGGFACALLDSTGLSNLEQSLESSLDCTRLEAMVAGWLRREPLFVRLRRARRWCSVAPATVTPWWRHGAGGSGPDRIFAAATLQALGSENWRTPITALDPTAAATPAALYALWWRWIQGHDDEV